VFIAAEDHTFTCPNGTNSSTLLVESQNNTQTCSDDAHVAQGVAFFLQNFLILLRSVSQCVYYSMYVLLWWGRGFASIEAYQFGRFWMVGCVLPDQKLPFQWSNEYNTKLANSTSVFVCIGWGFFLYCPRNVYLLMTVYSKACSSVMWH